MELFPFGVGPYPPAGDETWLGDEDVEGEPDENAGLLGSAKNSDGENASGLLWWEGESPLRFERAIEAERAIEDVFLRTGRIQGGLADLGGPSWRGVSKGMLVRRQNSSMRSPERRPQT